MLVQPFLRSVAEEGEYSILLFGGRFSHAIVKRPKAGDYRVQPHLGGTELPCAPPEGAIELAHAALAAAPAEAAYARVDMVRDNDGRARDHRAGADRAVAVAAACARRRRASFAAAMQPLRLP